MVGFSRLLPSSTRRVVQRVIRPGSALQFGNNLSISGQVAQAAQNAAIQATSSAVNTARFEANVPDHLRPRTDPRFDTPRIDPFGHSIPSSVSRSPVSVEGLGSIPSSLPRPPDGSGVATPDHLIGQINYGFPSIADPKDRRSIEQEEENLNAIINAESVLEGQLQSLIEAREQAIAEGSSEIVGNYNSQIAELRNQLGAVQRGRRMAQEAFEKNRRLIDPFFEAAVNAPLPDPAAILTTGREGQEKIESAFNDATSALGETLNKIGADQPALAAELATQVRSIESNLKDSLRQSTDDGAAVLTAAGEFTRALAQQAWSDDIMQQDLEKEKLDAQFAKQIENINKEIRRAEKARSDALSGWRSEVEGKIGNLTFDDFLEGALNEWRNANGLGIDEWTEVREDFQLALNAGHLTAEDAARFYRQMTQDINSSLVDGLFAPLGDLDPADPHHLSNLKNDYMYQAFIRGELGGDALISLLDRYELDSILEDEQGIQDLLADHLRSNDFDDALDLFELREDVVSEWDEYQSNPLSQVFTDPSVARYLTRDDMTRVVGGDGKDVGYMHPEAANAFLAMKMAAPEDVRKQMTFWDTYRSWDTQMTAWEKCNSTRRGSDGYCQNLAGNWVPNIAHPSNSKHPTGLAIDFAISSQNSPLFKWLQANGSRFGFRQTRGDEPWEWQYTGGFVGGGGTSDAPSGSGPQ